MERFTITLSLYFLFSILIISHAADTITKNQSVTDGKTIVSSDETFEMGFFSRGKSKNRYVGIWYKLSTGMVVWVANREIPLIDTSGVLKVIDPGILVLLNGTNSTIWSTNTSISAKNPVVQLLDSGNLVVRDVGDEHPENFLWQSFDYPCDTYLPGMKLGKNLVTGREWFVTSWKTEDDPARGDYRLWLDLRGYPQGFISGGSRDLFRFGSWNGLRFTGTPTLILNQATSFTVYFGKDEIYFKYEKLNGSFSVATVNSSGVFQHWIWKEKTHSWAIYRSRPADNCDNYKFCGAYGSCNFYGTPVCSCLRKFVPKYPRDWELTDWTNGCVRSTPLSCQNGDGFVKYSGIKLPDTRSSWYSVGMTVQECKEICLKNCSCMAYTTLNISGSGSGCLLWFGDLVDIRVFNQNGQDLYVRMASSDLDEEVSFNGKKRVIIVVVSTLFTGMLLLGLSIKLHLQKKKKNSRLSIEGIPMPSGKRGSANGRQKEDIDLPLFDFTTVAHATNDFSDNNKLGEGGFGRVYKGVLSEGQEIAVKRLSKNSRQGLDEFKNEVVYIAKLQHRNLVKLLGCCIQAEEMVLIYEYMPNKSLDRFIFDQELSKLLDWHKRFNIINGIARGLLYLHQDSRLRIVHRDLKAENVLLDKDMKPKISDFGLARSFGGNETEANTNKVVGTHGYISPEYAAKGLYSVKSDVYSFGVLVLEILCGRRNRGFNHLDHSLNLLGHAWQLYVEGRCLELIDASIRHLWNSSKLLRTVNIGLLCVQQHPKDRPDMSSVVLMLGGEGTTPRPKQPGFFIGKNLNESDSSLPNHVADSDNKLSITQLQGR